MTAGASKLLVTGGSGVLGSNLIAALGPSRCLVLRHRTPVADATVETIDGDLAEERLGLSATAYERLLDRIEGVVHAGALTSSFRPAAEVERVNVDGTRHVLTLAERAGVPLHHISTFYVRGRDGTHTTPAVDVYQSSKRSAESVVESATVPTATYRLPGLIGDARTGVISRFSGQAFYLGAKAIVSGNAHVMPASAVSYLDVLPRDHVAQCLQAGIDGGVRGTCWITAGRRAIPFTEFVEACVELAVELGRPVVRPRFVAPSVVERLVLPAFGDALPVQMRQQLRIANRVMLGMANESYLPDSREELPEGIEFPPLPDLPASLRASLRYWGANVKLAPPIAIPEGIESL
jgi:nucleoside-diphosphate-sugar epimerase